MNFANYNHRDISGHEKNSIKHCASEKQHPSDIIHNFF